MSFLESRVRLVAAQKNAAFLLSLLVGVLICTPTLAAVGSQQYRVDLEVDPGATERQDKYVDAGIDLTAFLAGIPGSLDVLSLQVLEVDIAGTLINDSVLFQFDQAINFDATTNAAGNLIFLMAGSTPANTTRYYQLAFDLAGVCQDCPPPPPVPVPVSVDSLTYENQLTYEITTPRATYMYHKQGGGLASLIDNDANDWISFHDVGGSGTTGEYRGIPNLVFSEGDAANSFFHPGFTNSTSRLVSSGPLKVTVHTEAGPANNFWEMLWEFYPEHAKLTVLSAGPSDTGPYWFLYEGTPGGAIDAGDVVVRSGGVQTSAFDYGAVWESDVATPEWVYFRDTAAPRALYLSNDQGDTDPDSYRPMGQTHGGTPQMTVFGFGRVLENSPNSLTGRMTGTQRSFTVGFLEDHTTADAEIVSAVDPVILQVGQPVDIGGPIAVADGYATPEDQQLVVDALSGVLANDTPEIAGPLTAVLQTGPTNGVLNLNTDGSFDYLPNADFAGLDSFTYRADESGTPSNLATVTLTVDPLNDNPVAADDSYQTSLNTLLTVDVATGVLQNDTDVDLDTLQAILASDVSSGSLTLNIDGSFDYMPNPGFGGTDTFTYRAFDGALDSLATVVIDILPPPTANPDTFVTDEDVALVVPAVSGVLANDSADTPADGVTAAIASNPTQGVLTVFDTDGSFTYTPDPDFHGSDSFTYLAIDGGTGLAAEATVTLTINPISDAPVALADEYQTEINTLLSVAAGSGVLDNDSDADLDPIQALLETDVTDGVLALNTDGSFDYTPNLDFVGTDSFVYRASDGILDALATVTLTVNDPSSVPRVTAGLVALYDFADSSGSVVADVSGVGSPLDLTIGNTGAVTWLPGGGLSLDSATIVRSSAPATKVFNAATLTNAITVEAWLAPASTAQNGPARIISCSESGSSRNFTLGQGVYNGGDDRYVMRLRTTTTDDNGVPETQTPVGSLTTDLTHVIYTRDGTGAVTIYLDGALAQSGFAGGTFANWGVGFDLALGNEMSEDRPWLGSYYLVAVYDRALNLAEIAQNYTVGPQGVPVPSVPAIRSNPVTGATLNEPYTYDVVASGYPAPVFSLTTGPAGMTIDPATGVLSWTPDVVGDTPVEISASNSEGSDSQAFTLTVFATNPLLVEVWHGLNQQVGHLGNAQTDFNILGKVTSASPIASLNYSLNGGLFQNLTMGPDNRRLPNLGDFNADIPISLLQEGLNVVTVRAIATTGQVASVDVNVTRTVGGSYNLPATINWNGLTDPQDVGQYVDGQWQLDGNGLRTLDVGYDRIFLIGDDTWQDYEVLVPVTINAVYNGTAGLGLLTRFTGHIIGGHRNWPVAQPKWGYQPFGGIGWLRWNDGPTTDPVIQFYHGDYDTEDDFGNPTKMMTDPTETHFGATEHTTSFAQTKAVVGGTYMMRMRCETLPDAVNGDGVTKYSYKIWESGTQEPATWSFEVTQESQYALREGAVGLLAHHVDATFGEVQIVEANGVVSGVETDPNELMPRQFVLHQNHPNPFNPMTSIALDIPHDAAVRVGIYDVQGHAVRQVFAGRLAQGQHSFRWDGRDESGRGVAGGVYFFRLEAAEYVATRKMTLVR